MITVTDKAKEKLISLMRDEGKDPASSFVRVGVSGGGCSGLMYNLEFHAGVSDEDKTFEDKGIRIAVDKKSFLYLIGTQLDYTGGLNGRGFTFINPNASRTCGCGESFAV